MDDQTIINLYWNRDEAAIEATSAKYGAFCRRIALNILRIEADADECVNDTYHAAWCAMPPERPSALRAFLGRITRNLSLDRWRTNHTARRGGTGIEALLSELDETIPARDNVELTVEQSHISALISRWLTSLPPDDCALFVRRYWYGDSITDLAAATGQLPNTVTKRLSRLRGRLRNILEQEGIEL